MSDPSARTEPPSPRALRRARERGDVPRSRVGSLAFGWLGLSLGLGAGTAAGVDALCSFTTRVLSLRSLAEPDPLRTALGEATTLGAHLLVSPFAGVLVFGVIGAWAIMGRVVVTPVRADFERLAPSRNLGAATDLRPRAGVLLAVFVLGLVLVDLFQDAAPGLFGRVQSSVEPFRHATGVLGEALFVRVAVVLAVLGAAAVAFARHRFWERQRMTRREKMREQRETEGDPTARRRRQARHRELSDAPSRREVLRRAALLVRGEGMTVALAWANRDAAPTVDAIAMGPAAARLVLEGRAVPSVLDPALALALARYRRGAEVPERLWPRVTRPLSRSDPSSLRSRVTPGAPS
ncbi:MAG: EscU/YscU/HrcU family type III secretion system export apparatus switch protein [Sandaracinaceae bacterium]